jgi:hypothetical protein
MGNQDGATPGCSAMITEAFIMPTETFSRVLGEVMGVREEPLSHVYRYRAYAKAKAYGAAWDRVFAEVTPCEG